MNRRCSLCRPLYLYLYLYLFLFLFCLVSPCTVALAEEAPPETFREFQADDTLLAYQTFLGAKDLEHAFQVAQRAVQQLPNDKTWRLRLVQIAQWTQRPDIALQQSVLLFQGGDRSDAIVDLIANSASTLENPELALLALQYKVEHSRIDEVRWADIFEIYEVLGEPRKGSRYFEDQYRRTGKVALLESAAQLAENAGDDDRALQLDIERLRQEPFSKALAIKTALMMVRKNDLQPALNLLKNYQNRISPDAADYWRLMGELAWDRNDPVTAEDAYTKYTRLPASTPADWSKLIFLSRQQNPTNAADLAMKAFRRFEDVSFLIYALELYGAGNEWNLEQKALSGLNPQELQLAEQNWRFLLLRAQIHQRMHKLDLALKDLRQASSLNPQDPSIDLTTLWLLMDAHKLTELEASLKASMLVHASDSSFWLAFASASDLLGNDRAAAHWYTRALKKNPQDAMALVSFADVLDRLGFDAEALQRRQLAWNLLKRKTSSLELLAYTRLAILNAPGDPAWQRVHELAQKLHTLQSNQADFSQARDLVLAWSISHEEYENAHTWMLLHYVLQTHEKGPLWGLSQEALQLQDTQTMEHLLAANGDALPVYNRYDIADSLGHERQALQTAFMGMEKAPTDEPLHDRYRIHAPAQSDYLQASASWETTSTLLDNKVQLEAGWAVNDSWHIIANWTRQNFSSSDPVLGTLSQETERLTSVNAQWHHGENSASVKLLAQSELRSTEGMELRAETRIGERISLTSTLNYLADTQFSDPMRLAGLENSIRLQESYKIDRRMYINLTQTVAEYFTQTGVDVGSGNQFDLELGYRIRTEYPDWRIRIVLDSQNYYPSSNIGAGEIAAFPPAFGPASRAAGIDPNNYFLPQSSTGIGACLGMGENLAGQDIQTTYTRAWLMFMDVCMTQNSVNGSGYTSNIGMAGSLDGADQLRITLQSNNATAPGSSYGQSIEIRYRRYF